MLLDEVFSETLQVKSAYVRRDGRLRRVLISAANQELPKMDKPLFPIQSPRYGPKPNDNFIGYKETDRIEDEHDQDR